jgi:hypothetical protein
LLGVLFFIVSTLSAVAAVGLHLHDLEAHLKEGGRW